MAACTQAEIDNVVERCKHAVEIYGGQSDKLATLRKYYTMLTRCREHGALVMVETELDKLGIRHDLGNC